MASENRGRFATLLVIGYWLLENGSQRFFASTFSLSYFLTFSPNHLPEAR